MLIRRITQSLMIAMALVVALPAFSAQGASAMSRATEKLCVQAFPGANRHTEGGTTHFNRQASVQAVSCQGFGFDVNFHIDGGIVCSLTAAAVGKGFEHLALFVDSGCNAASLATSKDVGTATGAACGMLSDLLYAFPPARAYATGIGVGCAFGKPVGEWIESHSERVAAEGVIRSGKCLRYVRHSFPLTDDWSAVPCDPGDPGFSKLPKADSRSTATQVVQTAPIDSNYVPLANLHIDNRGFAEACLPGSDSVGNAYRCVANHGIYDPCWTDDANPLVPAVICQLRPWEKRVYRLRLSQGGLQPFYGPPLTAGTYEPWGVELTTGERCIALQGAHAGVNGGHRIIDYACENKAGKTDDRLLLRGIDRSHSRWRIASATYNRARNHYKFGPEFDIVTAWYAIQDEGDARAAGQSRCSASALAFAAEAYEASHGEPNGPLPAIRHHTCSSGYAIAEFEQEFPSPGFRGYFEFHSSTSGWVADGSRLSAGDFDIPEDISAQLESGLSSAPYENVPF